MGAVILVGGLSLSLATANLFPKMLHPTDSSRQVVAAEVHHVSKPSSAKAGCTQTQANTTALFAACPSYAIDYAKQADGAVATNQLNIYDGQPEANHEAQYYTSNLQNIRVENGSLVLEAQNTSKQGYDYTSARIDTKGKADFLDGKLVVRATLPSGIGTWPAIWMLPSNPKYASLSPASDPDRYLNDGEIDIAESVGTEPHVVYGIAHSLAYPEDGPDRSYYSTIKLSDNDRVFHDYEVDWTPTNLTFSVDGKAYFSISKKAGADYRSWPYDQPFYLIVNLALGGSWGGTDTAQFPGDGVDKSILPASLKVQNITYYPYVGPR